MRSEVLGLPVDVLSRVETINMIDGWLRQSVRKPRMVVTAYSEFYVKAQKDRVFAEIVRKADLVTPDGVSVLAGVRYNQRTQGIKNARTQGRVIKLMVEGLRVGGEILAGTVGETVTGVFLFEELLKLAEKRGWKVFLLGGWGNVSLRTATLALERFPELRVSYDRGEDQVGTVPAVLRTPVRQTAGGSHPVRGLMTRRWVFNPSLKAGASTGHAMPQASAWGTVEVPCAS